MRQWINLFEAPLQQQAAPQQAAPQQAAPQQAAPQRGAAPQQAAGGDNAEALLNKILKQNYPTFVKLLGQNIQDPKFIAAIKSLAGQDKVDLVSLTPTVGKLIPTQNEIDIKKSLAYPLTNAENMSANLKGGPVAPGGPIITSAKGHYIIDGHHRWSQVCVCNPNCKIQAVDMSDIKGPFSGLKAAQLGIVAATGQLPVATVEGSNLLTIDQQSLIKYVVTTITQRRFDSYCKSKNESR